MAVPQTGAACEIHSEVVVVGGGLAGLTAAIEAYRHGANVILLEKEKNVGGNSAKATSGMNSVCSHHQLAQGIHDTLEEFEKDTIKSGGGHSDPLLVKVLSSTASSALDWIESFGITLNKISQCGGHSQPRTHREPSRPDGKPTPVGWDIIKVLRDYLYSEIKEKSNASYGSLKIITNARVIDILSDEEGKLVKGVKYEASKMAGDAEKCVVELKSDAVILATGGYAADYNSSDSLLKEFVPQYLSLPSTNGTWATGDGMKLGRSIGAWLVDMDQVQIHPTGFIDPSNETAQVKFLAPEALRAHGGLLLNPLSGERFTNELGTRDAVTADIFKLPIPQTSPLFRQSLLVLNQAAVDLFDPAVINFYISRGFFFNLTGPKDLAKHIMSLRRKAIEIAEPDNINEYRILENVKEMFGRLVQARIAGVDAFGKKVFPVEFSGADDELYYVCRISPSVHYTMGGLRINAATEIVRPPMNNSVSHSASTLSNGTLQQKTFYVHEDRVPIRGLYGAGEVTGGVHGKNRLAGNSLLECVVFSRIAGQRASKITSHKCLPALSSDSFTPLRFRVSEPLGKSVKLFRFDLPSTCHQSGLKVGEYIAVRAIIGEKKEEVIRYYSPVSRPDQFGVLDLLIKVDDKGLMSHYFDSLQPGDCLEFRGPISGFSDLRLESPTETKVKKIAMICGGTGISAMVQIIRSVFFHKRDDIELKLLYGAQIEEDLVFGNILEEMGMLKKNFKYYFTVDKPSAIWPQNSPSYGVGFLTRDVLRRELPVFDSQKPDELFIAICGPWKMCQALKPILLELGYPEKMWYSFM